ncbi:hypothetical protein D3C76_1572460 [compost metagenome]
MLIDGSIDLLAGIDSSIMPGLDNALTFEHGKLFFELISQRLVSMTIREEYVWQGYDSMQVGRLDLTTQLDLSSNDLMPKR